MDHTTAPSVRRNASAAGYAAASSPHKTRTEPMTSTATPTTTDHVTNARRDAMVPSTAGEVVAWRIGAHLPCGQCTGGEHLDPEGPISVNPSPSTRTVRPSRCRAPGDDDGRLRGHQVSDPVAGVA